MSKARPQPKPLTVAVVGDFGVKSVHSHAVAQLIHSWSPTFVITTGDNLYSTPTVKNYESTVGTLYGEYLHAHAEEKKSDESEANLFTSAPFQLKLVTKGQDACESSIPESTDRRFFPCVGNHDFPYGPYCDYFNLPTYYGIHCHRIDFGSASAQTPPFLRLYSINDYMEIDGAFNTSGSVQCRWLTHELQEAQSQAAAVPWIIVYFHHPIVWSSKTNCKRASKRPPPRFPFEKYGVSLILCGHHHFYERIQLAPGLQQCIVGTGGHSLRPGPTRGQGRLPGSVLLDDSGYGALRLEVDEQQVRGTYIVVEENKKGRHGVPQRVVDEFSIPRRK